MQTSKERYRLTPKLEIGSKYDEAFIGREISEYLPINCDDLQGLVRLSYSFAQ